MPVDFTNSETESAVEGLVNKLNGKDKTIEDAIEVLFAVNHDAIKRDSDILNAYRAGMADHLEKAHCHDAEIYMSYKIARWALAIAVGAIILFGVNTFKEQAIVRHDAQIDQKALIDNQKVIIDNQTATPAPTKE